MRASLNKPRSPTKGRSAPFERIISDKVQCAEAVCAGALAADHRRGAVADHGEARPIIRMRGVGLVHQRLLGQAQRAGRAGARRRREQAGDQPLGRVIIVGHRPVAGDHRSGRRRRRRRAPARRARIRRRRARPASRGRGGARPAGRVAGGEDDEVGVEPQVENLAEGEQAVRALAAEAGQQRRPGRAFGPRRQDQAVGGEMEDAIVGEIVARRDRGVGEGGAGDDLGLARPAAADRLAGGDQLLGRDRPRPGGERPGAAGLHREPAPRVPPPPARNSRAPARSRRSRDIRRGPGSAAPGGRRGRRGPRPRCEMSRSRPSQRMPRKSKPSSSGLAAHPRAIGVDPGPIHDQQIGRQPEHRPVGLEDQMGDAGASSPATGPNSAW